MKYIELFCGAGGGILSHSILHGHQIIAAAEKAPYPRKVLIARQDDGSLPEFDIHSDVCSMNGRPYRDAQMLAGGFPCQGISAAGMKRGFDDPRTRLIWEMLRIAEEAGVEYIFAENSPRLRTGGLHLIIQALQRMGYNRIAWCTLGASDVGAYHQRKRMWLLARKGGTSKAFDWYMPIKKIPADGMIVGNELVKVDVKGFKRISRQYTLPTLLTSDARASGNRPGASLWSLSDRLGITAKAGRLRQLPTLAATDWKSPYSMEGLAKQLEKRAKPLRDMLPYYAGGKAINPYWAEWYMGWPTGWTDLDYRFSKNHVNAWSQKVAEDKYWIASEEKKVLPATLVRASEVAHQKDRITALGNGQVPLAAAAAFEGLKGLLK